MKSTEPYMGNRSIQPLIEKWEHYKEVSVYHASQEESIAGVAGSDCALDYTEIRLKEGVITISRVSNDNRGLYYIDSFVGRDKVADTIVAPFEDILPVIRLLKTIMENIDE